jgi:hypothetical protein
MSSTGRYHPLYLSKILKKDLVIHIKEIYEQMETLEQENEWGKSATLKWNDELEKNKKLQEENEKMKDWARRIIYTISSDCEIEYLEKKGLVYFENGVENGGPVYPKFS